MQLTKHKSGLFYRTAYSWQDLDVINEVFRDDCYRICDLPRIRTAVDIGAHIGCFEAKLLQRFKEASVVSVEAHKENYDILKVNVNDARWSMCTYLERPLFCSSIYPNTPATGGSMVVEDKKEYRESFSLEDSDYRLTTETPKVTTLEDLLEWNTLDLLKLDCEGSEFSILDNTSMLDRIAIIVGEYHGYSRFVKLVRKRFSNWVLDWLSPQNELGIFRLANPNWREMLLGQ